MVPRYRKAYPQNNLKIPHMNEHVNTSYLLPLLNMDVFNLHPFYQLVNLPNILRCLRPLKINMVLNLLPPTEEDIFLILAFFVDAPCTTAREWCYSCSIQMRHNYLEDSVEFLPLACFDKISTCCNDWCLERDCEF